MKKVIHRSNERGHANHGWLDTYHSFSFANYYNPEKVHFGALRVLNDDHVSAGMGFGKHPHENMEIISIPLEGDLEHQDSMGNVSVIKEGDVQVMSAGTGVFHSEKNKNNDQDVRFLQIWVFPEEENITPNYDQQHFGKEAIRNHFQTVVSPNGEGVKINQKAWLSLGEFDKEQALNYTIQNPGNGVYGFVLEGEIEVDGETLERRDAIGIWDTDSLNIKAKAGAKVLLIDVPMLN